MLLAAWQWGDIDPGALILGIATVIISVGAMWVALNESRRNNTVIPRVRHCQFSASEGQPNLFAQGGGRTVYGLGVWIQNRGISLYRVALQLAFESK